MIRTRDEWYEFCMNRGTSGDQVFDILQDWKEEKQTLLKEIEGKLPKKNTGIPTTDLATGLKEGYNLYHDEAFEILREILGGVK